MGRLMGLWLVSLALIVVTPLWAESETDTERQNQWVTHQDRMGDRVYRSGSSGSSPARLIVHEGAEGDLKITLPTRSLESGFYIIFPNNPQKSCSPNVSCPHGEAPSCSGTQNACVCKCDGSGGGGGGGVYLNVNVTNN